MRHRGKSAWTGLLPCTLGIGCGKELYVMGEAYEVDGETRKHALSSCTPIGDQTPTPAGRGGSADRDLIIKQRVYDDSFQVVVSSDYEELARRKYGEKQLESGGRDEFTITTHAGRTYELAYWGGRECESSSSGESE